MLTAFRLLARLKMLRGTRLDPFGRTAERRMERRLIVDYIDLVNRLATRLDRGNHGLALEIAALPLAMRGFGHVKDANVKAALARQGELLQRFAMAPVASHAAE